MDLVAEAQAQYDRFSRLFEQNDFVSIKSLWDADEEYPFYIAEESSVLVSSWQELQHYWDVTHKINGRSRLDIVIAQAKLLAPEVMLAMFTMTWMIHLSGQPKPYGGTNRGFGILRRRIDGWRFIAHCEAPLAPISWMKAAYVELGERYDQPR